jgi:ribosomal protein S18 acetylase RimI-like enzyme
MSPSAKRSEAPAAVLRDAVTRADLDAVREIAAATGFFRADEIAVAVELAEDCLTRGPKASGYRFLFAEPGADPPGHLKRSRAAPIRGAPGKKSPLGYACFGPIPCTLASWDLYWIAVRPEHAGRGIGRMLMQALEQAARAEGCLDMYIETSARKRYDATRAFYLAGGYRIEHVFADFYAPGDGRAVYVKRLG